MKISSRGIPHLAKNQRDMGHPRLVVETEFETASSHTRSDGRPVEFVSISPNKDARKSAIGKGCASREMAKKYVLTY